MQVEASIIPVWAVYQGDDDRHNGYPAMFFSSETDAKLAAVGKGYYGCNAPVKEMTAIMLEKDCYILYQKNPVDLDHQIAQQRNRVKTAALAKLSPEEIQALGIKP